MRKILLLTAAVLMTVSGCSQNKPKGTVVVTDPASQLLSLEASVRDNYQIYQVNPELFGTSGQLKAVQERLDDIRALGTDILYLMPIYPEGTLKGIGSPYCIRDYNGVRSGCGSLEDVKALVSAAHAKGMKVMFDWVANHTAWDHPWIEEHPDWYEKDKNGNIVYPTKDGAWTDVAQLDFSAEALHEAMIEAMCRWVSEADIDGYRCDYAHGVPDAFWKKASAALKAMKPGFLMLAESDFEYLFDAGFDIIYDRGLKAAAKRLFNGGKTADFAAAYAATLGKTPEGKTKLYFVTNHDDASEASPVAEFKGKDGAFAAFSLLAALNGSPMLYSSQETGYDKGINFFNPLSINWNADPDLTARYREVLSALQKISRDTACRIYASERVVFVYYAGSVLVGVNVSGEPQTAAMPPLKLSDKESFAAYEVKIWNL